MSELLAGFGRQDITPPVGVHMMGYASRTGPSTGIHDRLMASALALSDSSTTAVIVALDVASLDLEGVAGVKRAIGERCGLGPGQVLLNTSHTHAGPMVASRPGLVYEAEYVAEMGQRSAEAAAEAIADLVPASLAVGSAPVDIGGNRREKAADGRIILGVNPFGARLAEVTVWRFARSPALDVVVFSIPIHGTTLGPENLQISAEWMGAAVRSFERSEPDTRALFLQGCAGDQNPYRDERTWESVTRHGEVACAAVRAGLRASGPVAALPLVNVSREIELPVSGGGTYPCPVHGLRVGDGVLMGLGGEAFVEYALHGASHSSARSTMVLGYTDGSIGYLPTRAAYAEGGYEVMANQHFQVGKPWEESVEAVLKRGIDGVLAEVGVYAP